MPFLTLTRPAGFATLCSAVAVAAWLGASVAQAADTGARAHAKGKYDTVTATYIVADGDDLFAIGERFEVPVDQLKSHNKLTSDEVQGGQTIQVPAPGAHASAAHKAAAKKPLAKMTCEDFLGLDETFQPKAVYWAVAYGKDGKPEAEAVDLVGVETAVPIVVEACKAAPKETFWQKAKAQWKKIEAKL